MIPFIATVLFAHNSFQKPMTVNYAPAESKFSAELESAVLRPIIGLETAWNTHDMDAYAEVLTEDCQWVNVVGMFWNGKPSVKKAHAAFHHSIFKDVSYHNDSATLRRIAPTIVIAIVQTRMGAYTTPDGHKVPEGTSRLTMLLREEKGKWLVCSAQNTTVDPIAAQFDPGK